MSALIRWPFAGCAGVCLLAAKMVLFTPLLSGVEHVLSGDLYVLDEPSGVRWVQCMKMAVCLMLTGCAPLIATRLLASKIPPWWSFSVSIATMGAMAWGFLGFAHRATQIAADSIVEVGPGKYVWPAQIPILTTMLPGALIVLAFAWCLRWIMVKRESLAKFPPPVS